MNNIREILSQYSKDKLIDSIIEYSDNGYFPLDIFLIDANYKFSIEELTEFWKASYQRAQEWNEQDDYKASSYLCDMAEKIYNRLLQMDDLDGCRELCQVMIQDLQDAAEVYGIGMYGDNEWMYLEICEQIKNNE